MENLTRILPDIQFILKRVGFVFLLLGATNCAHSQELDWLQFYEFGGTASTNDIVQIGDGYVLAGVALLSTEEGGYQGLVLRTDEQGEERWHRTIGSQGAESFEAILQVGEELWAFGVKEIAPPIYYGLLVAFSLDGDSLWSREYTALDTILFGFTEAIRTSDGNIVVSTNAGAIAIKLDINGNILWAVRGPEFHDPVTALYPMENGGVVVATNTNLFSELPEAEAIVYWIDDDGVIEDSAINSTEWALVESILSLNDEEIIVAGRAQNGVSFFTQGKYFFRMSRDRSIAWQHLGSVFPQSTAGVHLHDDTLYFVNYVHDFAIHPGYIFVERRTLEGDSLDSFEVDTNPTGQDFVSVRGTLQAQPFSVLITGQSDYSGPNTPNRAFLTRVGEPLDVADTTLDLPHNLTLSVYPNPFNSIAEITFDIPRASHTSVKAYDVLGREVRTLLDRVVQSGTHKVQLDADGLASGIYFVRVFTFSEVVTSKIALIR